MPKVDKVRLSSMPETRNPYTGGVSGGQYIIPWLFRKPQIDVLLNETRGGNGGVNEYIVLAHEAMHWLTLSSINQYGRTPEYKSLADIYDYISDKKANRIKQYGFRGNNYGLTNINEFMAELLVDKDFRDGISDLMFESKAEFEKYMITKYSKFDSNADLITILVQYVRRVIKDLLNTYGSSNAYSNIDFSKSMLDNATELAIKAYFETPTSRRQGISLKGSKQEFFSPEGPINEQNKPTENATPIGQEPAKKSVQKAISANLRELKASKNKRPLKQMLAIAISAAKRNQK